MHINTLLIFIKDYNNWIITDFIENNMSNIPVILDTKISEIPDINYFDSTDNLNTATSISKYINEMPEFNNITKKYIIAKIRLEVISIIITINVDRLSLKKIEDNNKIKYKLPKLNIKRERKCINTEDSKYFFIDVTFFKLVTLTTKTRMDFSKKERFMQAYAPVHGRFERYCKTRSYKEFPFEDLMQDTLLIAFEKFDNLKSKDAFLHFLFGTAAKVLSNYRKKKKLEYVENFSTQYEHINTSSIEIEKQK